MDHATTLSVGRIALGAVSWAAPGVALRSMMLDPDDVQAPFLVRLFGARDVALGVVTLLAAPEVRPALLKVGVAVDLSDAAASGLAARAGALRTLPATLIAGTALGAVATGLLALRDTGTPRRPIASAS
jgi:hypothetical protein